MTPLNRVYHLPHRKCPEPLMSVQRRSFQHFLNHGLGEEFRPYRMITVADPTDPDRRKAWRFSPEHVRLTRPSRTVRQCILKRQSYTMPLWMPVSTIVAGAPLALEWFKLVDLPLMTRSGHFIVKGIARVVLNQTVRSPGVHTQRLPLSRGRSLAVADFIAQRGTWLRLELNEKDGALWAKLKYRPRMPLIPFLRCFGMPNHIINTYVDVLVNPRIRQHRRLDEALLTGNRLAPRRLRTRRSRLAHRRNLTRRAPRHGTHPYAILPWLYGIREFKEPTDEARWYEARSMGPSLKRAHHVATVFSADLRRRFWNPRTYTLGVAGRRRLNQTLGLRLSDTATHLSAVDVLFGALHLLRTMAGVTPYADRDDLQYRTVKPVGVLLQNQLALGLAQFELRLRTDYIGPFTPDRAMGGHSLTDRSLRSPGLPNPGVGHTLALPTPSARQIVDKKRRRLGFHRDRWNQPQDAGAHEHFANASDEIGDCFRSFFSTNPLSQFLDETNGLAELTHKRRLSSLGLGGITRETATMAIRGIHPSHYGRICPIETPEGQNAGLVNSLTTYATLGHDGSLSTPLTPTYRGYVLWDRPPHRVSPELAVGRVIASGDVPRSRYHVLAGTSVAARSGPDYGTHRAADIVGIAAHPLQMTSVATGLIPFLEHDDGNRALMGSNMQRQAVPTYGGRRPIVGTGYEGRAAADVGTCVQAEYAGLITHVDGTTVTVLESGRRPIAAGHRVEFQLQPQPVGVALGGYGRPAQPEPSPRRYALQSLIRSNQGTTRMQRPRVKSGSWVQRGDLIAENTGMAHGDMAVGQNLLVGYVPWEGYNFEDAILVNRRLRSQDVLTSLHVSRYEIAVRDTRYGRERFTRDELPVNHYHHSWEQLDDDGAVRPGAWVAAGDTLVGKVTPIWDKPETNAYARLLRAITASVDRSLREASLVYPRGEGRVVHVEKLGRAQSTDAPVGPVGPAIKVDPLSHREADAYVARDVSRASALKRFRWLRRYDPQRRPLGNDVMGRSDIIGGTRVLAPTSAMVPQFVSHGGSGVPTTMKPDVTRSYRGRRRATFGHRPWPCRSMGQRPGRTLLPATGRSDRAGSEKLWETLPQRRGGNVRLTSEPRWRWSDPGKPRPGPRWRLLERRSTTTRGPYDRGPKIQPPDHSNGGELGSGDGERTAIKLRGLTRPNPSTPEVTVRRRAEPLLPDRAALARPGARSYDGGWNHGSNRTWPQPHNVIGSLTDVKRHRSTRTWALGVEPAQPRDQKPGSTPPPYAEDPNLPLPHRPRPNYDRIHVYVARERRVEVGDKLSGRHGNKGIISRLLPSEDMPYTPDGSPLDIVLNPLGVPSRMNVGQLFECLLGLAGASLNQNYKLQPFDEIYGREASRGLVYSKLYEARLKSGGNWYFDPNFPGKVRLIDGRSGVPFEQPVTVGRAYILKLIHLVDEKIHGRTTGPYSLITQQPLRGRANNGGQRLGEMEVWALEGFGASYTLQELITIKSDDIVGRERLEKYFHMDCSLAIGVPECFRVLLRELNGLGLNFMTHMVWRGKRWAHREEPDRAGERGEWKGGVADADERG